MNEPDSVLVNGIDFSGFDFAPVVEMPEAYEVLDLTTAYDANRPQPFAYCVGRYNEKRPSVYSAPLFADGRNIHLGVDIGAPLNTPVHAFYDGEVYLFGYNGSAGDYGYTLITQHRLQGVELYALYGHLSQASIVGKVSGQRISRGEVIAWIGARHENGGWNPHLHFQLSWQKPEKADLPGVVSEAQREQALLSFPDPRLVLGKIY